MKKRFAAILVFFVLLFGGLVFTPSPAVAHHYYEGVVCSEYPEYQFEEYYHNPPYSYAIIYWDMYWYCTDGHGYDVWYYWYSYETVEWR